MTDIFDVIVIGKGLVGSAAAKYLSQGLSSVALVGPDEPADEAQPLVYAAHYDEARVQRSIGWENVWTELNITSLQAYPELERRTGIRFHHTPGCLYVDPYGGDDYLKQAKPLIASSRVDGKLYDDGEHMAADFPWFQFPSASAGMFEAAPAGHINPRKLVQAQCIVSRQQGTQLINATVIGLEGDSGNYRLRLNDNDTLRARKVLVAAGSFANHLGLLPRPVEMRSKGETILLARLSSAYAHALANMPSLLYEWKEDNIEGIYLLPPVKYPDGEWYLKIGANFPEDPVFRDIDEIRDWFRAGDSERFEPRLRSALAQIVPRLDQTKTLTKRCIVSYTPGKKPYIGMTDQEGLYLAGGCNGYSAMCSDAMGSVAAALVSDGVYPPGYSVQDLGLKYLDDDSGA